MRLYFIADTHGTVPPLPPAMDAALVCGDFSDFGLHYERLFDSLAEKKIPVFFTSGNHETPDLCKRIAAEYGAVCLDYSGAIWQDFFFAGVGGYDIFSHDRRKAAVESLAGELWDRQITARPRYSILLSHLPPWPWKFEGKVRGDENLRAVLKSWRFDLAVVGHFHVDVPRLETGAVICPTLNPSFDGCLVDVDTATRQFKLLSFFGESV